MELEEKIKDVNPNPPDSADEAARDLDGQHMNSSMADPNGSSSDNESWTILDEDEHETDRVVTLNTRIDVIKATAQFSKRELDGTGNFESDSDIETIDEKQGESNLESLGHQSMHSDGIPVGDELSESGAQYIWSSDTDLTTSSSTQTTSKKITPDELEDDLEIIDENSDHDDDNVDHETPRIDSLCPSGYPPEELMERFAEIVKGRTYLHRPNQSLNLYLTATLAIAVAVVIGLGFGHFKGWSERLELQEHYADVREERMEELTESLVTCMTGEEGRGGDDQDLDDLVIRQLRDENEKLRFELQMLREITDQDNSAAEEMTVILRDRINDLLVANADLEKEVVKLKYTAPPPIFNTDRIQEIASEKTERLKETKESLNNMFHENDQLKLLIAKERYGPRQVPIEAKQKLNILQTENEELKSEVRKFRYGVNNQLSEEELLDEAYNSTEEIFEDDSENDNFISGDHEPNFVTLSRVQNKPILPPVIVMGGRLKEAIEDDTTEDDDEGFVEDFFEDYDNMEPLIDEEDIMEEDETTENDNVTDEDSTTEEIPDYFQSFTEKVDVNKVASDIGQIFTLFEKNAKEMIPDSKQIQKIKKSAEQLGNVFTEKWQELEKNTKYFLPDGDQEQIKKFKQSAEELGSILKQKWNELDWVKEKDHLRHKLSKTISKALDKAKDVIEEDLIGDGQTWGQRLHQVQEKFQSKWEEAVSKFTASDSDTCKGTETKDKRDIVKNKEKNVKKSKHEDKRKQEKNKFEEKTDKEIKKKNYSSWSKKSKDGNFTSDEAASWLFERAKKRDAKRKENKKSDWLFERASSRKRFHNLLTESEWYNRRLYNKYCDDGDCSTIDQDTFHVKKGKKFTQKTTQRGETEPLKNRQGFKFATNNFRDNFKDDDDDDDDKYDKERQEDYIRVQRNFGKTSRRRPDNTNKFQQEKKFGEKHNRGQDYKHKQEHNQRLNKKLHRHHLNVNMMHNSP